MTDRQTVRRENVQKKNDHADPASNDKRGGEQEHTKNTSSRWENENHLKLFFTFSPFLVD
jgi:hypothetical protein